jgi:hypothetical protein
MGQLARKRAIRAQRRTHHPSSETLQATPPNYMIDG